MIFVTKRKYPRFKPHSTSGKGKHVSVWGTSEKESQGRDDIYSSKAFLMRKSRKSTRSA